MPERIENRMVVDGEWLKLKPIFTCDCCEDGIYKGNDYYNVTGDIICEHCIEDYIRMNFRREA